MTNPKVKERSDGAPESSSAQVHFWMSSESRDPKGREAHPTVIQAALKVYPYAEIHCQMTAGDSILPQDLMEKAVYAVSGFVQRHGMEGVTSSLEGVVFAAFDQFLKYHVLRQDRHIPLEALQELEAESALESCQEVFCLVQMENLLRTAPPEVKVIFKMLYEEYNCEDIGRIIGIPPDNVRAQVCYWRRKIKGLENFDTERWKQWRKLGAE